MYSSCQFQRVKLFEQANEQLQRLIKLKENTYAQNDQCKTNQNQQSDSQLTIQSRKTIQLFNQLIRAYSLSSSLKHIKQSDRLSHRSNPRSHSRTHAKTQLRNQQLNDSESVLMISTLSCTLAYLYTNYQNRLEDAAGILLKSKGQIEEYMLQEMLNSKAMHENQPQEEQSQVEEYFERVNKTTQLIPATLTQFMSQKRNHALNKYCQFNAFTRYCQENISSIKTYIRVCVNLVINLILQSKYSYSVQVFNDLVKFIDSIQNSQIINKCLEFISVIWFGSSEILKIQLTEIGSFVDKKEGFVHKGRKLTVEQAISMSHLIFNLDLLSQKYTSQSQQYPQNSIILLEKSLQTFISNQMYKYAFFTLRHLIQSVSEKQKQRQYQYLLNQLIINQKLQSNLSLQNIESIQCFRCIVETLLSLRNKYKPKDINRSYLGRAKLFCLIIKIQGNRILYDQSIDRTQKSFIVKNLNKMLQETNPQIIQDLLNQEFTKNIITQINSHSQIIINFCQKSIAQAFKLLKFSSCLPSKSSRIPLSQKNSNNNLLGESSLLQQKSQLKNISVSPSQSKRYLKIISTSMHSQTPSVNLSTTQRKPIFQMSITDQISSIEQKRLNRMVRLCQYGAFLNKRNFNSDGGQFKFIKVTSTSIKWHKTAQKIDEQGQCYPLKDIKGILYGKITPNLKKPSNKSLKQQLCFSLILQKRTMDFYCKDFNEVQTWVCGLSQILKKQGIPIVGYTPGKMKWRKMFALLRRQYIEPLKIHQRNRYYFQNAYSLIMFKENGYKLSVQK